MRLLIFDFDGIFWDYEDVFWFILFYEFYGDYFVDVYGEELYFFLGVCEFFDWVSECFFFLIVSWNVEEKVRFIFEGFGFWDYFLFLKIEGYFNKVDMIWRIIEEFELIGYIIDDVIYVDDRVIYVDKIK